MCFDYHENYRKIKRQREEKQERQRQKDRKTREERYIETETTQRER
jgi:hypothetical protein